MPHPLVTFITHWCCLSEKLVAKNQSCPAKTICSGFLFVSRSLTTFSRVATSLKRWWWMFCVHWVWVFSTKTRKTKLTLSERLRKLPSHSETITHSPSQICHLEWTGALAYETPSYGLSKGTVKVRQQYWPETISEIISSLRGLTVSEAIRPLVIQHQEWCVRLDLGSLCVNHERSPCLTRMNSSIKDELPHKL